MTRRINCRARIAFREDWRASQISDCLAEDFCGGIGHTVGSVAFLRPPYSRAVFGPPDYQRFPYLRKLDQLRWKTRFHASPHLLIEDHGYKKCIGDLRASRSAGRAVRNLAKGPLRASPAKTGSVRVGWRPAPQVEYQDRDLTRPVPPQPSRHNQTGCRSTAAEMATYALTRRKEQTQIPAELDIVPLSINARPERPSYPRTHRAQLPTRGKVS